MIFRTFGAIFESSNILSDMSKKFTEYSHFDLSEINKEVLKKWDEENVFHKSLEVREGCHLSYFMKDRLLQTECRVFIT